MSFSGDQVIGHERRTIMRAVQARGFGGVEVLQVAEVAVPAAGPGQVRIRVEAAAVNPVDLATRSGALTEAGLLPERDLVGLGWDVAGVVAEAGEGSPASRSGTGSSGCPTGWTWR
jgi:NADPH:quinone reductase-like Zn-dependent oxidoreductase